MGISNITESGQNDTSDHRPNSFREHRVVTVPNCRETSIADDDTDEESESNSDDGSSSSFENDESPVSEDSDNLIKSQITSPLHNLTLGSDTPADSVKSNISETVHRGARTGSSSESSDTSSSDEESDCKFEWTREWKQIAREKLAKIFNGTEQSANNTNDNEDLENDKSKDDNGADNMSLRSDNNTVSSQNQQSDITSEDDSDDDGQNIKPRGRVPTKSKSSCVRYEPTSTKDRESHRGNHTTETSRLESHAEKLTTQHDSVTEDVIDFFTTMYTAPDITQETRQSFVSILKHLEKEEVNDTDPSIAPPFPPEVVSPPTVRQPLNSSSSQSSGYGSGDSPDPQFSPMSCGDGSNQTKIQTTSLSNLLHTHAGIHHQESPNLITLNNILSPGTTVPPTTMQNSVMKETSGTTQYIFESLTANSSNSGGQTITAFRSINVHAQTNQLRNHDVGSTSNSTSNASHQMNAVPSVAQVAAISYTKAGPSLTRKSKKSQRLMADICYWKALGLPSTGASGRLQAKVGAQKNFLAMMAFYPIPNERWAVQNRTGNTYLMTLVSNPNILWSRLAHIGPLLSKMEMITKSLTLRNDLGYDALYLAAINCPGFDFVTGVLAAVIFRSQGDRSDVWKRTYNENREDTLIHVLAAKDDTHAAVLQELFLVQESSGCTLFDLSAKNIEGKTPLLVAIEARNRTESGIRNDKMVQLLRKYDTSSNVMEERNGGIAPHMAPSNLLQEVTERDFLN